MQASLAQDPDIRLERPSRKAQAYAQAVVLAVLFAVPALMCLTRANVADPDIWWHLRTGQWILQHHAVPRVDLYSAPLGGKPWLAYSWLFELLVTKLFERLGLVGIVTYSCAMILVISVALYHLVRRLQIDFTLGALLALTPIFCLGDMETPRPWLFSILFFTLELDVLMQVRKTGRKRELAWLPVIFALWSNIHIEFVYGLFIAGLAFLESLVAQRWHPEKTRARPTWMGCALLAAVLGTLVNPFGWGIYNVVYDLVTHGGGLRQVSEMQAIPFRDVANYCVLFFALASAAALAWTRRFRLFETGLLTFAAIMSFRSQRDVWLMAIVAAAILASSIAAKKATVLPLPRFVAVCTVIVAACVVWAGFHVFHVNEALLQRQVDKTMPVRAVEAIRANGYAGPLFNDFNWGGYLIWTLPMPVAIDGRTNLYGNERMDRSIATWNALPNWSSDTELTSAGVVIGPVNLPLVQLLRMDSHFKLVYEDKVAAVFVARR